MRRDQSPEGNNGHPGLWGLENELQSVRDAYDAQQAQSGRAG